MESILIITLAIAALYAAGSWLYLAYRSFRFREDWEEVTFHLGLCFILAAGFLLIGEKLS